MSIFDFLHSSTRSIKWHNKIRLSSFIIFWKNLTYRYLREKREKRENQFLLRQSMDRVQMCREHTCGEDKHRTIRISTRTIECCKKIHFSMMVIFDHFHGHQTYGNGQNLRKHEHRNSLDFIAPFNRSRRKMKKTYIYSSLISNNKRDMNIFQYRHQRVDCRDISKLRNFFNNRDQ